MEININIKEFEDRFSEIHAELYDNDDDTDDFDEAVETFDELLKKPNFRDFVGEFVDHRGDFISSDRECAAFMYAFNEFVTEAMYGDNNDEEL